MELRTYVLIDSMQPQYAALTGVLLRGDVPVEGMAEMFIELMAQPRRRELQTLLPSPTYASFNPPKSSFFSIIVKRSATI